MPIQLPITTYGMGILRKKAKLITEIDTNLISLIENMFYTMVGADGDGLAAPQVNMSIALSVIDVSHNDDYRKEKPLTLINPVIIEKHGESSADEGCLSIPGLKIMVKRAEKILVRYSDFSMKEITREFEGYYARVVQHETDHLNGVLSIDYLDERELKKISKLLNDIKRNQVEAKYPLYKDFIKK